MPNLRELLKDILPDGAKKKLVASYDIIGHIAIIKIPDELILHQKAIAEALMSQHKRVKTVVRKLPVQGTFRTRQAELVAGEPNLETTYRENGYNIKLDIEKVFFSPRMGTERMRVASQIKNNENVLVMFAGTGVYAIAIAKEAKKKGFRSNIVGIELNPDAVKYFEENIKLNKIDKLKENGIEVAAIEGDVKEVAKDYAGFADRIAMPLPMSADDFLGCAFACARDGCVVHYYKFAKKEELEAFKALLAKTAAEHDAKTEMLFEKNIKSYARDVNEYAIDFRISKKQRL
ncbi:class I SAM-dependent methyltransferase family protein [Candidatus Micrarchaeota archaeon CG_4_10_14_0_2_um_filter_49_7]|nr:MAG: hypothetical protein AUJ13_04135 [Candidatus Micrarchaeota archaeon CG1_02_49_24]PIZ97778.1 MAG: class I SAM-dependent methyltransferase family protein [Candidatus Micrarchaeota archaeon CG_4_10_14_0_2_um_filter_49_7]HII53303.1 class I SAM-dependent methyltransferase family protein [Candidatus Micrarchaeota archaeon]